MKLAEALIWRSDCNKRLERLRERMSKNARVQEGETPSEDPRQLLVEHDRIVAELTGLVQRINRANTVTRFDEARSLTDALAERDPLLMRHKTYRHANRATLQPGVDSILYRGWERGLLQNTDGA